MILLKSKISIPPLRPGILARDFILDKINKSREKKLTLVSAPAGFGKSSIVSFWAHRQNFPVAWYSMDEDDNELSLFFRYLLASLQSVDEDLNSAFSPLLQDVNMPEENELPPFIINQLSECVEKICLVFDDFHMVQSPSVLRSMDYLISNIPEKLHVIIVTRHTPDLAISRMRAANEMVQIGPADLKFTSQEAEAFFSKTMQIDISENEISELVDQTEGWIVGLQMAGVAIKNIPKFTKSKKDVTAKSKFVFDYLLEEVISSQSSEIRSFLLKTSVLRRFNLALCNAVTGTLKSAESLDRIERSGLFLIPLDNDQKWFRYHHLFGEFLQHRLEYYEKEAVSVLHKHAGDWFESHGNIEESFYHARKSGDFSYAADILERNLFQLLANYRLMTVRRFLRHIPLSIRQERYLLRLCRGYAFYMQEEFKATHMILSDLNEFYDLLTKGYSREKKKFVKDMFYTLQICNDFYMRMPEDTVTKALSVLKKVPEENENSHALLEDVINRALLHSGEIELVMERVQAAVFLFSKRKSAFFLGYYMAFKSTILIRQGALYEAQRNCEAAFKEIKNCDLSHNPALMYLYINMAEIKFRRLELDDALYFVTKAKGYAEAKADIGILIKAFQIESLLRQNMENGEKAMELMIEAQRLAQNTNGAYRISYAGLDGARLALMQSDYEKAGQIIAEWDMHPDQKLTLLFAERAVLKARLLLHEKKFKQALDLLIAVKPGMEKRHFLDAVLEADIIAATCLVFLGKDKEALSILENAVVFAMPQGYIMPFSDYFSNIADLLVQLLSSQRKDARWHASKIINECRGRKKRHVLTPREIDILRLISAGFSNREIAEQRFVSVTTVKSHINSIFTKLEVSSRNQAVLTAKEKHIL